MKGRPFALIGVNSDRDLEAIRKIVVEKDLNWRSFQNQPEGAKTSIAKNWAVSGWPTLIVIDADFKIRHRSHDGEAASALAKQLVDQLEARLEPQDEAPRESETLESLQAEYEKSELSRGEKYAAFKPRFVAFAKAHEGSPEGFQAEFWVFRNCWAEREAGTMTTTAKAQVERMLELYPQERGLAKIPEIYYVLDKGDRADVYAKIAFISEHDVVKAACLYGHAQYGPAEGREARFAELAAKYGELKWKHSSYAALAEAHLKKHGAEDLAIGKVAPEIVGVSPAGKPMKLSDYRGKVVVLDFWGDW